MLLYLKSAGWGDVGFVSVWTMEITNNSTHYMIPLVVGRRIAQIVFFETEGIVSKNYDGKYQSTPITSIDQWDHTIMLPKLYLDKEIKKNQAE